MTTPFRRLGVAVPSQDGVHLFGSVGARVAGLLRQAVKDQERQQLDDRTALLLDSAGDLSAASRELANAVMSEAEARRLSPARSNLIRLLDVPITSRVLEIGAGAGAVTRYLGETCESVDAVEGDAALALATARRCAGLSNVRVFQGPWEQLPRVLKPRVQNSRDLPAGGDYDLIVFAPDWGDFTGASPVAATPDFTRVQTGLARLSPLLATGGRLIFALPGVGRTAEPTQRTALTKLFDRAGLTVQQVLNGYPDHVRTTALVADGASASAVRRLVTGSPRAGRDQNDPAAGVSLSNAARESNAAGSLVLIAHRADAVESGQKSNSGPAPTHAQAPAQALIPPGPLFPHQLRTTTVDGLCLQAVDVTLTAGTEPAVLLRQVHRLDRPGTVRVNGGAVAWSDRPTVLEQLLDPMDADDPLTPLRRWAEIVRGVDELDGADAAQTPRFTVLHNDSWTALGGDVRVDGWSPDDLVAHGVLDSALHAGEYPRLSTDPQVRKAPTSRELALTWGRAVGLADGWLEPAIDREAALISAVAGGSVEATRAALVTALD